MRNLAAPFALVAGLLLALSAHAGSQVCGYYVFGGAYRSESQARRNADILGAMALDLRTSNSPNNHMKLFVVAEGPFDSQSDADRLASDWKSRGVRGAYVANRCFTGD